MYKRKPKHDYAAIYQRHLAGETISKISKDTGIHIQSIYTYFQKNNWKYNKEIQIRQVGYYVDDNYLDNIDTEDKAYFLGWMLSDGCISKNKLGLKLKYGDEYIITEMFNKFSIGYKIIRDKNGRSMSLSSTKMISALAELGCVENKTEIGFNVPNISNDLFRHFVRGYFDGDGTIGINTTRPNQRQISICSIDNNFLIQLQEKLLEHNISTVIYKENRNGKQLKKPNGEYTTGNKDMFRLTITTHKERLKFYEFLYDNCSIKLMRKYVKYNEYYTNIISNEVDEELVLRLFEEGRNEYSIHKETKISRCKIKRIISNL